MSTTLLKLLKKMFKAIFDQPGEYIEPKLLKTSNFLAIKSVTYSSESYSDLMLAAVEPVGRELLGDLFLSIRGQWYKRNTKLLF